MPADVLQLRLSRERDTERVLDQAEEQRKRMLAAAQRIKETAERMSAIYRERLEGRRRDD